MTKQTDLSEFGFIAFCQLPRQSTLIEYPLDWDSYIPKGNAIFQILVDAISESIKIQRQLKESK